MTDPVDPGKELAPTPQGGGELGADDEVIEAELVEDDEDSSDDGETPAPERRPGTLSKSAKTVLWIAGAVVAALLLVAFFLIGTRISTPSIPMPTPTPTPTASPTPTPTPTALPAGPIGEGVHRWDALLGGECLDPFDTAWQDEYVVVNCAVPHPAQLVTRGTFADPAEAEYPGLDQLSARMNLLCTAPSVVDYAVAGAFSDIQVEASFAVDAADWESGNRTYFCFLSRTSGEPFSASIALPQAVG